MTHPASRATPDPRGQIRWPRGTPWHRRGPGPGRWAPEGKWGLVHDAIAAGEDSAEHAAMVQRANNWAATLDQRITPRAPRAPRTPSAPAAPEPDFEPPRTPGGRIGPGPHIQSQTMFSVGGHSYWTLRDFLQNDAEVRASRAAGFGQPNDPGLEKVAKRIFEYTDPDTGYRAIVERVYASGYPGRNGLSVSGVIRDASGIHRGKFERQFYQDGEVHHGYFKLDSSAQGGGFQTRWFEHALDGYAAHGFDRVTVHADIDVGGYAWAKQGFDFQSDYLRERFMDELHSALRTGSYHGARYVSGGDYPYRTHRFAQSYRTQKALQDLTELERRHQAGEKITAFEVSQVGKVPGSRAKMWAGKRLMLRSDWHGVLVL